jgi:hypothetical protein
LLDRARGAHGLLLGDGDGLAGVTVPRGRKSRIGQGDKDRIAHGLTIKAIDPLALRDVRKLDITVTDIHTVPILEPRSVLLVKIDDALDILAVLDALDGFGIQVGPSAGPTTEMVLTGQKPLLTQRLESAVKAFFGGLDFLFRHANVGAHVAPLIDLMLYTTSCQPVYQKTIGLSTVIFYFLNFSQAGKQSEPLD